MAKLNASSALPLIISASLKKQYVVKSNKFNFLSSFKIILAKYLLAIQIPTDIPIPSPA